MSTDPEDEEALASMTPELLLVDDNPVQAATRQAILARGGIRIALACSAFAALEIVRNPELGPGLRLIVTDHLMPGMNGPEMVTKMRDVLPGVPVLVLSGMPGAEAEYEGLEVSFHLKPFPPEELIRTVNRLLAEEIRRSA